MPAFLNSAPGTGRAEDDDIAHIRKQNSRSPLYAIGKAPEPAAVIVGLEKLSADFGQEIKSLEAKQDDRAWARAKAKIERLSSPRQEVAPATRTTEELNALHVCLVAQATLVSGKARENSDPSHVMLNLLTQFPALRRAGYLLCR